MIYLDNAATTMPNPLVVEVMKNSLEEYGNPSSIHIMGRKALELVDRARENVAHLINCSPDCIYFTSGGTESNNWAIYNSIVTKKRRWVAASEIEHHSVHNAIENFGRSIGAKYLPLEVNSFGVLDVNKMIERIYSGISLISVMYVNNEIGTIQPIKEISKIAHISGIPLHVDAVQAAGKINIDVQDLDVDYLSLSGHKIHGPKGVGVLYIKPGVEIHPMISGGHQESGYRAGTYNVPGIVGMGEATRELLETGFLEKEHNEKIGSLFWDKIKNKIPDVYRNGNEEKSVSSIVNICFEGIESKSFVLEMSKRNICCSSGSACNEGETEISHVLKAIGLSKYKAHSSVRFSFSIYNTEEEISVAIEEIANVVSQLRKQS